MYDNLGIMGSTMNSNTVNSKPSLTGKSLKAILPNHGCKISAAKRALSIESCNFSYCRFRYHKTYKDIFCSYPQTFGYICLKTSTSDHHF